MPGSEDNRQVRRTRAALLDAFRELILERRYQAIRVGDIIRRANVGRSTFYEHFRDKDDLLRHSLSGLLTVVADAVLEGGDCEKLPFILEHFRQNSRLARGMLNGPSAPEFTAVLAQLIEERLTRREPSSAACLPLSLVAAHTAEGQLGLIRAWLNGGAACASAIVAQAMHHSAVASTRALLGTPTKSAAP